MKSCWGAERAMQIIVYEARKQFLPEERIWLTNQIIHNPTVNKIITPKICGLLFLLQEAMCLTDLNSFDWACRGWMRWA